MNLSICIITKNESNKLRTCLSAIRSYGTEATSDLKLQLVVVDTGSTDGSKAVAEEYTEFVYEFNWCDDFSAAKNYAVSKACYDMVLVLDTDEYLEPMNQREIARLCRSIENHPAQIGRIKRVNGYEQNGEWCENTEYVNRIFDRRRYHYEGRIHEQLVARNGKADTYLTNLTIIHDGYGGTKQERSAKAARNKKLLLEELAQTPSDTYLLYQLGKSSYMSEDYQKAVKYFELALGYDLNPKLEYVIDMVETYGYALLQTGQVETALQFEGLLEEFGDNADFSFLMGLIYMNNELFDQAVQSFLKAVTYKEARALGANSFKAYYNAGVIRECLGDEKQAGEFYEKCGSYEKAKIRLNKLTGTVRE